MARLKVYLARVLALCQYSFSFFLLTMCMGMAKITFAYEIICNIIYHEYGEGMFFFLYIIVSQKGDTSDCLISSLAESKRPSCFAFRFAGQFLNEKKIL